MKNTYLKARIIEKYGTQTRFAHLLEISEDRLSKLICGRLKPRELEMKEMARCLGIEVSKLFNRSEKATNVQ